MLIHSDNNSKTSILLINICVLYLYMYNNISIFVDYNI